MRNRYPIIVLVIAFVASVAGYLQMPERVPIHWDMQGQVDGWGHPFVAVGIMPLIMVALWQLLRFMPKLDPKRPNIEKFRDSYDVTVNATLTLMLVVHFMIIGGALGLPILSGVRLINVAIGVFFIVIGNVLPRTRRNWLFGIRTWWTMSDDRVWAESNRVGGYLMAGAGVLIALTAMLEPPIGVIAMAVVVMVSVVASVAYSYAVWKRVQARP